MKPVTELKNLGPRSVEWLASIGVETRSDLERIGSVAIYARLKADGLPVSLNLLYAIEAALLNIDWRELPGETKAQLKYETLRLVAKRG